MKQFSVSLETLETLFPFSFIVGSSGEILHLGRSIRKIAPSVQAHEPLHRYFRFHKPQIEVLESSFTALLNQVVVLEDKVAGTRLMGQFIKPSRAPLYAFVGSLVVTEAEELTRLKLNFNDFPIQDQVFDFLMLTQTHKRIIREAESLNKRLLEARDTAVKASELKSQFLANMSHELRTPMNGVLGMASILLETTQLAPDQLAYVNSIIESAENMLALINDILDLSKIESGFIHLDMDSFDLRDVLNEVHLTVAVGAQKKGNFIDFKMAPGTPEKVYGDRLRLRQVLMNLVGNANKFTNSGKVLTHVSQDPESPSCLRFTVQDTGIGMNEDLLSRIFSPFVQGDGSLNKKYGGTGLGLSICKKLVEAMGGKISVSSQLGVGTEFTFSAELVDERKGKTNESTSLDR